MSDHGGPENEEVSDLSSPEVTTKYRLAGDIINKVIANVVEQCVVDADILTLCEASDKLLEEETGKLYNKTWKKTNQKKIEKGVAFPTCISVNEIVGNFSPLKGESRILKAGDVCKIDMAAHIDGFIAAAAHTLVVGDEKVEDKRADVLLAAWTAAEAALRLVQVGNTNTQVTAMFSKVADEFKCKPVQGLLSHQLKKHVINGSQSIISVETPEHRVDGFKFEMNEVYCINVVMSTGEGKTKETEIRSTVYKRAPDLAYALTVLKARKFLYEVDKRFPSLPFTLRAIKDEQIARVGVAEAKRHSLLEEYPVLAEKVAEVVAQFKFTVLLLPAGTKRITGLPLGKLETQLVSANSVQDPDLKKLLASSAGTKEGQNRKKQNKKKGKAGQDEEAADAGSKRAAQQPNKDDILARIASLRAHNDALQLPCSSSSPTYQ